MEMDTILYNSLIDAYVRCGDVSAAYNTFLKITQPDGTLDALPNVRTYNTMLKGFVPAGSENRALELTRDMMSKGIWDDVTTNTLVSVLVSARNFELAESVLSNHTSTVPHVVGHSSEVGQKRRMRHPNVEAYTDLLNGYGKAGQYHKALFTLKVMRHRGVNPNEYTYSCMIGALAKTHKISQAKRMLDFMEFNDEITPSAITYNAFLAGMLEKPYEEYDRGDDYEDYNRQDDYEDYNRRDDYSAAADLAFNGRVDVAVDLVKDMLIANIRPNAITVATMIDALGRCNPPRLNDAKAFANKFDELGYVPLNGRRVSTAMMQACSLAKDFNGVCEAYTNIAKPDLIAYNVYLDSCCRCGQVKAALDAQKVNVARSQGDSGEDFMDSDVVTYTVLLTALLNVGNAAASELTRKLYREMKQLWGIKPDKGLVDM